MGDPRGGVVLERWRLAAAQRPDDPCEEDRQPVPAGVDDACLAQHRKQLGAAPDRLLTGCQRVLDQLGEHLVLLRIGCVGAEPGVVHVREIGCDARGHLANHREDRALGRVSDRAVGLVGRPRQRRADQNRVDELSGPACKLFRGAADQLRQDHPGVAARAEQCGTGDRADDLGPADVVDRAVVGGARKAVELLQDGSQRQHHVVAGIAVGDREHIEVVDLLAPCFERGQARLEDDPETNDAGIGHGVRYSRARGAGTPLDHLGIRSGQSALVTLPAFRQRVQTYTRRGVPESSILTRCRFGSKRRLVATIEWLRLWPNDGPFPQTWQTFGMAGEYSRRLKNGPGFKSRVMGRDCSQWLSAHRRAPAWCRM